MNPEELTVHVDAVSREAEGVVSLTLRAAGGDALPSWEPGAHIDVHLPDGLVRQYSLCGDGDDPGAWRIAVLLEPESRGGSKFIHESIAAGARLRVGKPRNHFGLTGASEYYFIAGGIGITPILAMARKLRNTRPWKLLYGGRSRDSMAFVDEVSSLGGEVTVCPQDETGLLDLGGFLGGVDGDAAVYCCGPGPLIDAVTAMSQAWSAGTLRVEKFRAAAAETSPDDESAFTVELARSGKSVEVAPMQSITAALLEVGVRVPTSCQEGVCGTCETKVLSGTPDHRDSILTDDERSANATMMLCCSRSIGSRLVLDL